jgi:hypothetical protein
LASLGAEDLLMNPTRFTISNCAPPFVNLRRLREMVIFRPKCA